MNERRCGVGSRVYWRPLLMQGSSHSGGVQNTVDVTMFQQSDFLSYAAVEKLIRDESGDVSSQIMLLTEARDAGFTGEIELPFKRARLAIAGMDFSQPSLMGILNVTPDSFYDGGRYQDIEGALTQAFAMIKAGADCLDIGGESTRPGAKFVQVEEEIARVVPVIKALKERLDVTISIDTRKAAVMKAAVEAGADIINDVSALSFDPEAPAMAARLEVPVVLMHAKGTPENMQDDPFYDYALLDVYDAMAEKMSKAVEAGIKVENIILDPGIGFGKSLTHNLELMRGLSLFHGLGCPLLLGASRKRFIAALSNNIPVEERLPGSIAAALAGFNQGVQIYRVHDVAETRQALDVINAIYKPVFTPDKV